MTKKKITLILMMNSLMISELGCRNLRPRWEIQVSLNVESKIDANTKTSGGIILKRPLPQEKK